MPSITLGEISQTEKDKYCMISLIYWYLKKLNSDSRVVVARGWGQGKWGQISSYKIDKFWEPNVQQGDYS